MTELTLCEAKDATSTSRQSASVQLQLPWQNWLSVKPRMPQAHQDSQLHSSSSHHDWTYKLSSQGCRKHIKTVSLIPAPVTMTELTRCQAKDTTRTLRQSTSLQLQPSWQNLLSVKPRIPQAHQDSQLHSSSSHHDRTYLLLSQGCHKHIKTVSFIAAPATMTELTACQAKDATSTSRRWSAAFQLQPLWQNLPPVKPRMPQAHQDSQLHSSSSHHDRTYSLWSQGCHKHIKTVSFIPAPATMTEHTFCEAKDATSTARQSPSFQFQPPRQNLPPVKPRMPQAHQDSQLHSSSSHHDRTYLLSCQGCPKHIKIVSFIPAPAIMTELTSCQGKDATSTSRWSASFQLQPPWQNLPTVKPRMPPAHQDSQLHSSSSHHDRTYLLSIQGCHKHIKTVSFITAPATMTELTLCQAKDAASTSRQSASFHLQPPWQNLLSVKPRMPQHQEKPLGYIVSYRRMPKYR
jgi:hypothetical protein